MIKRHTPALWVVAFLWCWLALPSVAQRATSQPAGARSLATTAPEAAGLSTERLGRMHDRLQTYVEEERLAGLITFVARRGEVVHFAASGMRDREAGTPMTPDTIFRIYSMTKPITTVAALMLYEEGRFQLGDPVARYLPALEGVQVYDAEANDGSMRAAARRPVTIRDLMTHTSGLTYGFFSQTPVDSLYREVDILDGEGTLADMVEKLGRLPLLHQPGTRWHYSVSTDVLGRLVEVVSGQPLDAFFEERIFEPLGMVDTGFMVPADKLDRFAVNYTLDEEGHLTVQDAPATSAFAGPVSFLSGGGGLVSTPADYFRFAQMLLNKGALEGTRLLGRKTVELMTTNHLDGEYAPGYGFGLGVRVCTDVARTQALGSEGEYGWAGLAHTYFFIDPEEEMIGILWTQFFGTMPTSNQFKTGVYQAVID